MEEKRNLVVKASKKRKTSLEDLVNLSKEELLNRILQMEIHNNQLKSIINKSVPVDCLNRNLAQKKHRKFDFTKCCKRHVLLKLLYLGWDYQGYTVQEDTTNTIEHHLFGALTKCCLVESRQTSNYARCGRTDKGVSSFCQVVSLDIRSKLTQEQLSAGEDTTEELDYPKILNRVLPLDIRVLAWCPAPPDFSARFDCKQRTYKYFFPRGNLDIKAMDTAVQYVVGSHDFRNLCKMDVGNGVVNYDRRILSARVNVIATESSHSSSASSAYDMCELTLVGQAYLWHQVRCIMGILLLIGQGRENPEVMKKLLDIENQPRKPQYQLASHVPLNLFHCEFDCSSDWVISNEVLLDVIRGLQQEWTMCTVKSTMIRSMLQECQNLVPGGNEMREQSTSLLQGVQSKVYQPLFQRPTCSSLENRIEHFVKKQRLEVLTTDKESIPVETQDSRDLQS